MLVYGDASRELLAADKLACDGALAGPLVDVGRGAWRKPRKRDATAPLALAAAELTPAPR